MDVLGHEDVAEDEELVTLPEPFERVLEGDSGMVVVEVGEAAITAEGDEVIMSFVW